METLTFDCTSPQFFFSSSKKLLLLVVINQAFAPRSPHNQRRIPRPVHAMFAFAPTRAGVVAAPQAVGEQ
jgi:hypothetical protein